MQSPSFQTVLTDANKLIADGRFADAIPPIYAAVKQQPKFYQGWLLFSRCLFEVGHIAEAIQISQHAEQADPLTKDFQKIQQHMQNKAFTKAEEIAKEMLKKQPHHPRAYFTLANIELSKNRPDKSVSVLEQGIAYLPANLPLRRLLLDSYVNAGYFAQALSSAKALVQLNESFDTLWTFIGLLLKYGQHEELLVACNKAYAFIGHDKAKQSQIDLLRGQALRILGQRDNSIQALQAALQANPRNADAWWALADFKNHVFSSQDRIDIEALLDEPEVSRDARSIAIFALAKVSETEGDTRQTMALYDKANRWKRPPQYHPEAMVEEFNKRMQAYTKQALAIQADKRDSKNVPIFIVGLPRSGSTLVEQILASHEQIEGTLEQPTLPSIERRAERLCQDHYQANLSNALERLTPKELSELGQAYLDDGALFRSGHTRFFTDKQPFNFRLIGLIHKILPHALIIDVRRNPLDCGLSLYKQYFHSGVDFSYQLSDIGEAYKAYVRLMDHWHSVLPKKVLQVQYECLVKSPEAETKRILAFIGVRFDPNCLTYYETERAIHTASSEQVRQPINNKGIDAWRSVEASLSELQESLGKGILE
jgi:tetratricopeptide (TPR) repeat protein